MGRKWELDLAFSCLKYYNLYQNNFIFVKDVEAMIKNLSSSDILSQVYKEIPSSRCYHGELQQTFKQDINQSYTRILQKTGVGLKLFSSSYS